ncbi:2-phosphosulfolactate phosphatase [Brevibacillus migulae]|uniref:2-phosphosulfolactate phosphatase n=1 Tax=Brevibacillus migulae TaxID=1644114 RepID=UPI00106E7CCC|nr:2-phosphosulfolactate phosphatase [Brevibacillus migulae]
MRLEVVPTVGEIKLEQISNRVVIVIDVLRASSTIVTALHQGFEAVIPVETAGQALSLRNEASILAGERYCKKHPSFDLNNSPTSLFQQEYGGKHLILSTTNGTRAIQKADRAHAVLIGCLLNATSCMKHALTYRLDITLYCAGTREEFALEDGLAAGLMIEIAKQSVPQAQICDLGEALHATYLQLAPKLPELLADTTTGKRLVRHQFQKDILFCGQIDFCTIVPTVKEGRILRHLVS